MYRRAMSDDQPHGHVVPFDELDHTAHVPDQASGAPHAALGMIGALTVE